MPQLIFTTEDEIRLGDIVLPLIPQQKEIQQEKRMEETKEENLFHQEELGANPKEIKFECILLSEEEEDIYKKLERVQTLFNKGEYFRIDDPVVNASFVYYVRFISMSVAENVSKEQDKIYLSLQFLEYKPSTMTDNAYAYQPPTDEELAEAMEEAEQTLKEYQEVNLNPF